MPFTQGISLMKSLAMNAPNRGLHSNQYIPVPSMPSLLLHYPGYLKPGDYKLEFNGKSIKHEDIVLVIYQLTQSGYGQFITCFLVDLYRKGLNANSSFNFFINVNGQSLSLTKFKYLVYWLILQEDINFPRPNNIGIRMPLIRYIEGAIAAEHPNLLPLSTVIKRTSKHGGPPYPAFSDPGIKGYLTTNIQAII
ncbi:hypothetical protein KXS12_24265 [Priestia filamentosa]|uniref:hypothetical protein n=1 Tax=Priestia filamentosa TaxID=1402861 RepID=UPI003F1901B5